MNFARYGLAAAVTVVALVIELLVQPAVFHIPFLIFTLGVGVVTAYGGRGPGVVAMVVSTILGNMFFHTPAGFSYDLPSLLSTAFFVVVSCGIIWLVDRHRSLVERLRRDHDRRNVVADASAELERSMDFQATLAAVAWLAVPRIADWCCVDLIRDGKRVKLAVAHRDPKKIAALDDMLTRYPPAAVLGVERVIASGKPVFTPRITKAEIEAHAVDQTHLMALRYLGFRSYICMPIHQSGKVIGVISVAMAESGRYYTEEDLDLLTVLSDRAAIAIERAELFAEAQQQRARAEAASRAKDEFLAILGHELRNPLAPIKLAVELMAERDPHTFERERTVIERQVRQLGRLVDDLLDVTRIVRGRIELRVEPLELAQVVTCAVETTGSLIEERKHYLSINVPPGLWVLGDEMRLVQVISNLLTNAAKYTEPGGRIVVTAERDGPLAILRVRDNGVGIAHDVLPHVFDMFVQESQSLDRVRGGLGLGLAIVRNLVHLHHGEVSASSEGPGKGSEFVIRLPAIEGIEANAPATDGHRIESVGQSANGRPVLVVDDNRDALDLLADGLERRGIRTVRAYDGPSALALAANARPHVALLDIGLPVMDGYELARRLHQLDDSMQLVAVTGYSQPGDIERTKHAGFVAHLVKPVVLDQIQTTVEKLGA